MREKKVIKMDVQCPACNGTGLYAGITEKEGCAVVCHQCEGTGCFHYEYSYLPFEKRIGIDDINRVFKKSAGFVHAPDGIVDPDGTGPVDFSEGGCSYENWLKGDDPLPLKKLYCPKSWTGQSWDSELCKKLTGAGDLISRCEKRMNGTMGECWEEWEWHEKTRK